ncbi:UDP-N-acetylmuramate dehydrogenase [Parafrigoribacterium mesophilum]|uniref:UDP-N-acetylmuramate dehydrogenase n=1 Tax=Parafrigoribacterium mesophilum TaxID=433646 RepID=UPI0031FD145C
MSDSFADLTSIRVGGPAPHLIRVSDPTLLIDAAHEAWADAAGWLLLGGGSNLVVGDDGFDGTVVLVATRGIEPVSSPPVAGPGGRKVRLRVQAGEPWDAVVAYAVDHGLAGIEALSGIPGSSGAAPIQNIGAYGQELASRLIAVEFLDHDTGRLEHLPAGDLEFGYRTSAFKRGRLGLVVSIELELDQTPEALSDPVAYPQLADALGVGLGDRVPIERLRAAVLALRAGKGMLLSPDDSDSVSAGSFFTNPIVSENFARSLPAEAPRWRLGDDLPPQVLPLEVVEYSGLPRDAAPVASAPQVKLSAAWLIEHSGIGRGFALPGSRAAISSKHTLAIVNTGGATAAEVAELARYVRQRVGNDFGIELHPEPVLVGIQL